MDAITKKQDWFRGQKFGLFIHWGLYAIPAWHEQIQWRKGIPRSEYELLINRFNPKSFDPSLWLDLADEAGMEYICFTAKHHDGFCMWDTGLTEFNVMNSPCKKDILGMLAKECRKRKFPLCLYYSVVDWHHPNYPNMGRSHELARPEEGDEPDMEKYLAYLKEQVRELCTRYGEIRAFWWDMNTTGHRDPSINDMIRSLQPSAVINNRGFDEGDFGTPEREYPETHEDSALEKPAEACNSAGTQSWGYKSDEDYYSTRHLIRSIDSAMSRGRNYLLNAGPDAHGKIPTPAARIIKNTGSWYLKVKESFSGGHAPDIRKSGIKTDKDFPHDKTQLDGAFITGKGKKIYIHLNSFPERDSVILAPITQEPEEAVLLNTGKDVECRLDFIPSLWTTGKKYLRLRKIPVNRLSNEVPIIRLKF